MSVMLKGTCQRPGSDKLQCCVKNPGICPVESVSSFPRDHIPGIFYSWRSASIGFRLAALIEGSRPKRIPIAIEKITENIMAGTLIADGVCETLEIT